MAGLRAMLAMLARGGRHWEQVRHVLDPNSFNFKGAATCYSSMGPVMEGFTY